MENGSQGTVMDAEKVLEDRNRQLKRGSPHWRKYGMPQQNISKIVRPIKEEAMSNQEKMFCGISLTVIPDNEHGYLMSTEDVADGFGTSVQNISNHKTRHNDELVYGKHFIKSRYYTDSVVGQKPVSPP